MGEDLHRFKVVSQKERIKSRKCKKRLEMSKCKRTGHWCGGLMKGMVPTEKYGRMYEKTKWMACCYCGWLKSESNIYVLIKQKPLHKFTWFNSVIIYALLQANNSKGQTSITKKLII